MGSDDGAEQVDREWAQREVMRIATALSQHYDYPGIELGQVSGWVQRALGELTRAQRMVAAASSGGPIDVRPGRAVITLPDGSSYEIPMVPVSVGPARCDPTAGVHVTPHRGCTLR